MDNATYTSHNSLETERGRRFKYNVNVKLKIYFLNAASWTYCPRLIGTCFYKKEMSSYVMHLAENLNPKPIAMFTLYRYCIKLYL